MKEKPFNKALWKLKVETFLKKNNIFNVNYDYLYEALTHSSFAHEHKYQSNERLAFLGDAMLTAEVSMLLFERYPDKPEGFLSIERAKLVSNKNFAEHAKRIGLDKVILLGKGECVSGGNMKQSILASSYEALVAALSFSICTSFPNHILDLGGTHG